MEISDRAGAEAGVFCAGVVEKLFALVAPDIAEDSTVFCELEKPIRARCSAKTVRAGAHSLHNTSDSPLGDEVTGVDGTFDVEPLAEIDHVFSTRFCNDRTGFFEL